MTTPWIFTTPNHELSILVRMICWLEDSSAYILANGEKDVINIQAEQNYMVNFVNKSSENAKLSYNKLRISSDVKYLMLY